MNRTELKDKHDADLHELLLQMRGKLRTARFQMFEKQLKNVRDMRAVRKDIARILTVLRERRDEKK